MAQYDIPGDLIWSTDNVYDIPTLLSQRQANGLDAPAVTWGSVSRKVKMRGTWHFYTDDYRFTALFNDPSPVVETGCVAAVEPNVSITQQMPTAVALFRLYQKRWIARYWQSHDIDIIVDLNVAPKFTTINLLGVPRGWRAYATRGYNRRVEHTQNEYDTAVQHAETGNILFAVFGGGSIVQQACIDNGWTWIPEHWDRVELNGKNL